MGKELVLTARQRFRKEIGQHFLSRHVGETSYPRLDQLAGVMVLYIDVPGAVVKNGIPHISQLR